LKVGEENEGVEWWCKPKTRERRDAAGDTDADADVDVDVDK
jgi:hypothetical protein